MPRTREPVARPRFIALIGAVVCAVGAATCGSGPTSDLNGILAEGTWGGDDAAAIVTADLVHVHFGCTNGNFPGAVTLDSDGRFSVTGDYLIDAYPVARGPTLPAELAGVVKGLDLTMTVAVNDTTQGGKLVIFGPTTVRLGQEPKMQICPICESPPADLLRR